MKMTTAQLKKLIFESVKEALEQEISEADIQFFDSEEPTEPPLNVKSEELSKQFGIEMARRFNIRPWIGDQVINFARRMMIQLIDREGKEHGPYAIHSLDPAIIVKSFRDNVKEDLASAKLKSKDLIAKIKAAKAAALKEFPESAKPPGRIVQKKIDWSGVAPRTHYGRED
jgi:hypothetical protein